MLALAAAHREELEILGITTVSGNQDIKKVTANALNLAEFYGLSVPVAQGNGKACHAKNVFCAGNSWRKRDRELCSSVFRKSTGAGKGNIFLSAEFWENFLRESRQRSLPQAL